MMDAFEAWLPKLEDIEYRRAQGEPEYQNIGFDSLEVSMDLPRLQARLPFLSERFKERYGKRMVNCETLPGWQIRLQNRMDEIANRYEFAYELMEQYRSTLADDVLDGYHDVETTSDELSGTDTLTRSGTDTSAASGTDTTEDDSTSRSIDTPDSATNADPAYADSRQDDDRDITTTYGRTDTRTLDLEDATAYGKRRDIERDLRRVLTGNVLEKISGGIRSYTDIDTMFVAEFENNFLNIFWYRGGKNA